MKKLKLLSALLILLLTGCSLAQPERITVMEASDQFVGVYVVFGDRNPDRSHWVEYGSSAIDTEFGTFDFPNEVLFASYDEASNHWTFPGLDGYCAFVTTRNDLITGTDGLQNDLSIAYQDDNCTKLEGTIYIEKSDEDYFVTYYKVYETPDGRIYTDGSGDSMSGPATGGSSMGTSQKNTSSTNGEVSESYEFSVSVAVEPVVPTASLTLIQYDENDAVLSREAISLEEQHITPHADTAWMVVIEEDFEGNFHRTAYEPPDDADDWTTHNFYLSQEDGSIHVHALFFD